MNSVERVKMLCKEQKIPISKLERECGFANGYIGQLKKGVFPDNRLKTVADYLKVTVSYLLGETENRNSVFAKYSQSVDNEVLADEAEKYQKGLLIPVLGNVAAGIPIEAIEPDEAVDWEEIPMKLAKTGKFFGLKIKGDSMSPRILDGDVVIVRAQDDAESGEVVIAKVNGDDACCKRLVKYAEGITLQSFNSAYDPMYFSAEDMKKKPVTIIGKVVELRGKM